MKRRVIAWLILAAGMAAAQAISGWEFNEFLFFEWLSNPPAYVSSVAAGSPCYAWVGRGRPEGPQPPCFYDPSNLNPGYVPAAREGRDGAGR